MLPERYWAVRTRPGTARANQNKWIELNVFLSQLIMNSLSISLEGMDIKNELRIVSLAGIMISFLLLNPAVSIAQLGNNQGVLNPNTAKAAEMAALPDIGNALAAKIVAARPLSDISSVGDLLGSEIDADEKASIYEKLFTQIIKLHKRG